MESVQIYTDAPKRPSCERCRRPLSHCLCAHIPALSNRVRVLVLQHPDEARHPLNTGRLAVLGLRNAELLVGERFAQLDALIAAAWQAWLLFPGPDAALPAPLAADAGPSENAGVSGAALLIVPDGTWRKARQLIQANPVLDSLPRLGLPPGAPSRYRVRKAREPGAVSTIEAIARTLAILEPGQDFQPLLKPFDVLVGQQIQAMGEDVYRRNHSS